MVDHSKISEDSLFDSQRRWLFATNRANVLPILSSGLIRPVAAYEKYYDDLLVCCPGLIPVWPNRVPASVIPLLTSGQPGMFPVLVEFDPALALSKPVASVGIDCEIAPREAEFGDSRVLCHLLGSPVPYAAISCLHFMTRDDLEDFAARDFENVLSLPPLRVTPSAFTDDGPVADELVRLLGSVSSSQARTIAFRRLDSAMGAVAMLSYLVPANPKWFGALAAMVARSKVPVPTEHVLPSSVDSLVALVMDGESGVPIGLDVDGRLLRAAIAVLLAASPRDGWVESRIVSEVTALASIGASDGEVREIEDWGAVVTAVAKTDRLAGPMDDGGSVVRRALMLLVLRVTPERIAKAVESTLRPGPQVTVIAAMLSGLFHGYSRLPRQLKSHSCSPSVLSQLAAFWCQDSGAINWRPVVSTPMERQDATSVHISVAVDGAALVSRVLRPDDSMMRAFYHAKSVGFPLEFDPLLGALVHEASSGVGVTRRVVIELGRTTPRGQKTIRIRTACAGPGRKSIRLARREDALDLLTRNHDPATQCRFALEPLTGNVEVIADQILDTMDSAELQAHIEAVVVAASDYESTWSSKRSVEPYRTTRGKRQKSTDSVDEGGLPLGEP
jgi:hypothetical protein